MASFGNMQYTNGVPLKVDGSYASTSIYIQPELYNCYMSKRYPSGSPDRAQCFRTTVYVDQSQLYGSDITNALVISGVLLDSGATSNFISRAAVNKLGFAVQYVPPQTFEIATGEIIMHNQIVWMRLSMAGVVSWIRAYVDDGHSNNIILFGMDGWREFRLQMNAACGTGKKVRTKVTVADVEGGNLRHRIEVHEDKPGARSEMRWAEQDSGSFGDAKPQSASEAEAMRMEQAESDGARVEAADIEAARAEAAHLNLAAGHILGS